jgi:hypothetical protein
VDVQETFCPGCIEEVFVWMAVTYATTIVFEVVKIWQASGRPAKDAFLETERSSS